MGPVGFTTGSRIVQNFRSAQRVHRLCPGIGPRVRQHKIIKNGREGTVHSSAKKERASNLPRIDVLLEIAGIATTNFSLAEGHERTITVNMISTFMLGLLLLPMLKETANEIPTARPYWIIVSSECPNTFEPLDDQNNANMKARYPTSKLLEVLVVREIASKLADSSVILNMLNPAGWLLWFMKLVLACTTEVGGRTLVAAATVDNECHGAYMTDGNVNNGALGAIATNEDGEKA
ncbi:hypothetical protein V1506DRAFT_556448 [Lipomyces tetrasporus]